MQTEFWTPIPGFNDRYEISNLGKVRSLGKRYQGKILAVFIRNGFPTVQLSRKGKQSYFKIHRLLALTFLPNPKKKRYVLLKDGNPFNYSLQNLLWISAEELHQIRRSKELWESVIETIKSSTTTTSLLAHLSTEFHLSKCTK